MTRGRPPTPLQSWGAYNTKRVRPGAFRSRVRVRDDDGITRQVTAMGTTKAAAERALREKLTHRAPPTHESISRQIPLRDLAVLWLTFLRTEGRLEATTINEYERLLSGAVLPHLGDLRLRELSTSRVDAFIVGLAGVSASRQRKAKVVLGAMLDMAVRHDALIVNPVRQTSRLRRPKTETRSLTLAEVGRLRTALRQSKTEDRPGPPHSPDLNDVFELMLGTGARIGEILALRWSEIDLDSPAPTLTITGTIKSEPGRPTYRKDSPKTDAGVRTLVIPRFALAVLQRRRNEMPPNPLDAVFVTRNDTWHQVVNMERQWRKIRQAADLDWVTPHIFRKTVATLISERVDAETASKQLGHSSSAITREFYIAKPVIAADVADVLEELADTLVDHEALS